MSGPVVVKVGGSLLEWPPLAERLGAFLASRSRQRLVLLAGGGRAVDLVRDLDRECRLSDEQAHKLAMRALDLTAHLLKARVPGLVVVDQLDGLEPARLSGRTPLLAPRRFLERDDQSASEPLPHSWAVTSDSIAARLAERLHAEELVLLKSAPLPEGIDRVQAVAPGLVDDYFPIAARRLPRVLYRNLRDAEAAAVSI